MVLGTGMSVLAWEKETPWRERAETSLQKLSSRFEVLVQSSDDAIIGKDLEGRIGKDHRRIKD